MRITIQKMEVKVPNQTQQLQGMRTAKIFERELERIAERNGERTAPKAGNDSRLG